MSTKRVRLVWFIQTSWEASFSPSLQAVCCAEHAMPLIFIFFAQ